MVQADASAPALSEKVNRAAKPGKKCCHGLDECDYCKAMDAFDAWLSKQTEEIQELSLLEQIDVYAASPSDAEVNFSNDAESDPVSLNQILPDGASNKEGGKS